MLRNKKYGMGGAVQSFSSPMLAQGMQGNLSGFGTSGLQTFAKGGEVGSSLLYEKVKHINKKYDGVVASKTQRDNKIQVVSPFFNTLNEIKRNEFDGNGLLQRDVNSNGYVLYSNAIFAKGGEIIDQYEGRTPADIWFNLTKSQRRHLLLDHANIPSGELSSYIGDDTSFDELPHFVKQIVKKHFAEGQYAKGGEIDGLEILDKSDKFGEKYEVFVNGIKQGHISKSDDENYFVRSNSVEGGKSFSSKIFDSLLKAKKYVYSKTKNIFPLSSKTMMKQMGYAKGGQIASIGDSGIITDKNSMFVGKMALITGDLGNMYEVRVGERTTIVKKNGIRIVSDEYAHGGEIHNSAKQMSDEDFEIAYNKLTPSEKNEVKSLIRLGDDKKLALATILAESKKPSSSDFYKRAYEYANGGEITHLPEAKKVSKEDIEQFIRYVDSFYGKNGIYADYYEGVNSKAQIRKAVMTYLNKLDSQQTWGGGAGDSLDRERVGQILKPTSKPTYAKGGGVEDRDRFNSARTTGRDSKNWEAELKEYAGEHFKSLTPREREEIIANMQRGYERNTNFAKGGQTSTFEVYLEAVPNRDFDQSSHEANVRVPKLKKSAKSVAEAVSIAKKFIQDNDLGGSNFLPAKLYKNGKQVGFISYNGRVWNSDQSEMKYAQGGEMESEDMDVQFIEYKDNEIMYEPHYKKYYANDVEFDSLKDAQKFLDSGKISNDIRGAYQRGLFAKGGQTNAKRSKITLIMDGQKYSYPVAIVNGQVEITDETFKDGVLREYLDKEFDLWLDQAPSDYEEMYYGDESIMSKKGAIEGAMEYVSLTIEDEAPKKTTFNFDEGDIEFDSAYEYERGGSIAVSDDEKRKSLKGNLKIKF